MNLPNLVTHWPQEVGSIWSVAGGGWGGEGHTGRYEVWEGRRQAVVVGGAAVLRSCTATGAAFGPQPQTARHDGGCAGRLGARVPVVPPSA